MGLLHSLLLFIMVLYVGLCVCVVVLGVGCVCVCARGVWCVGYMCFTILIDIH